MTVFGSALEAELDGINAKNDRERKRKAALIYNKWLAEPGRGPRFRDPSRRARKDA